jgi:hypothetical protein
MSTFSSKRSLRLQSSNSTLRAIVPRGVRLMVYVSNPFEPVTFSSTAKKK